MTSGGQYQPQSRGQQIISIPAIVHILLYVKNWQSSDQNHFHNLAVPTNFNFAVPTAIPNMVLTPSKNVKF